MAWGNSWGLSWGGSWAASQASGRAWGNSWGLSWGNSWGDGAAPIEPICPSVVLDVSNNCISRSMISGEVDIIGWNYTEGAKCLDDISSATSATWEILSGTAISLGISSLDDINKITASFVTAAEVGKTSVKTTIYLDDGRIVCGVINFKVYEC